MKMETHTFRSSGDHGQLVSFRAPYAGIGDGSFAQMLVIMTIADAEEFMRDFTETIANGKAELAEREDAAAAAIEAEGKPVLP